MKAPRREFVVEYKSTRRQTKAQPKSIWGNLDLGAVARQVDADDVLPAEQPIRSQLVETRRVEPASSSDAVIDTSNVAEKIVDRQPIADADPETVDVVVSTITDLAKDDVQSTGGAAISRSSRARTPSPHSERSTPSPDGLSVSIPPAHHGDDIVTLDAENRRLKRLMVDKLRSENDQLRSILGRLAKVPAVNLG